MSLVSPTPNPYPFSPPSHQVWGFFFNFPLQLIHVFYNYKNVYLFIYIYMFKKIRIIGILILFYGILNYILYTENKTIFWLLTSTIVGKTFQNLIIRQLSFSNNFYIFSSWAIWMIPVKKRFSLTPFPIFRLSFVLFKVFFRRNEML